MKAKDDYTLEVRLSKPTPFFLQLTAYTVYYPVYKKGLEEDPKLYENGDSYVSNGPFKMEEWKHDSAMKAVKNEHYREKDRVKLGGIEWAMVSDPSFGLSDVQNRESSIPRPRRRIFCLR